MNTDIAVIGGGASGLTAAISAKMAAPNARVTVIERMDKVGRKLLVTGSGRCNLGNKNMDAEFYHGSFDAMKHISSAPAAAEFMSELGILTVSDSEGRLYPRSNNAASVLNALRIKAAELGIDELCNTEITEIKGGFDRYVLVSDSTEIKARRVIICAGGYAGPQYGTDGKMLGILRKRGYKTAKICPAVAPLRVVPDSIKGLKGVRVKGRVSAVSGGKTLAVESGEIQFTENSISGICVFDLAYLFTKYEGKLQIALDLLPDMDENKIESYLYGIRKSRGHLCTDELLTGIFVRNLASYLVKRLLSRPLTDRISELTDKEINIVASGIKALRFEVTGCSSWQNAQVTSGGIHSECVTSQLESKLDKGIFFAGEILDVDGICGGYNLQWAWSSGIISGKNCGKSLNGDRK